MTFLAVYRRSSAQQARLVAVFSNAESDALVARLVTVVTRLVALVHRDSDEAYFTRSASKLADLPTDLPT